MSRSLAPYIDHTALKPDTTYLQIFALCEEAQKYGFASVCVNPSMVPMCADLLRGSGVKICTVIGFPLGANASEVKAFEAAHAIKDGADELDMVIDIGALKDDDIDWVSSDITAVREASVGKILKVIIETALLTDEQKVTACEIAKKCGADFVKTSTGFNGGGATVADIALMRQTVGPDMGIKASGGIRDAATAQALLDAGATRLGCSASVTIVTE